MAWQEYGSLDPGFIIILRHIFEEIIQCVNLSKTRKIDQKRQLFVYVQRKKKIHLISSEVFHKSLKWAKKWCLPWM